MSSCICYTPLLVLVCLSSLAQIVGAIPDKSFRVSDFVDRDNENPALAFLKESDGKFVVTWEFENQFNGTDIVCRIFDEDANEVTDVILVNVETNGEKRNPDVAALSNENFVIVWDSVNGIGKSDIFGQLFNKNGNKIGVEFLINTNTIGNQDEPAVAGLNGGGFVVAWIDRSPKPNLIKAQIFNANGDTIGGEFAVNFVDQDNKNQKSPAITDLKNGGFVIVYSNQDVDILGQIFNSDGTKVGEGFKVNSLITKTVSIPRISNLGDRFVVTWENFNASDRGVSFQRFHSNGNKQGEESIINFAGSIGFPDIANTASGFVIVWKSFRGEPFFLQRFDEVGNEVGGFENITGSVISRGGIVVVGLQHKNTEDRLVTAFDVTRNVNSKNVKEVKAAFFNGIEDNGRFGDAFNKGFLVFLSGIGAAIVLGSFAIYRCRGRAVRARARNSLSDQKGQINPAIQSPPLSTFIYPKTYMADSVHGTSLRWFSRKYPKRPTT